MLRGGEVWVVVVMYGDHLAWIPEGYRGELGRRGSWETMIRCHMIRPNVCSRSPCQGQKKETKKTIHMGKGESLALAVSQHPAADYDSIFLLAPFATSLSACSSPPHTAPSSRGPVMLCLACFSLPSLLISPRHSASVPSSGKGYRS